MRISSYIQYFFPPVLYTENENKSYHSLLFLRSHSFRRERRDCAYYASCTYTYTLQLWCLAFAFLNNQLGICFSFAQLTQPPTLFMLISNFQLFTMHPPYEHIYTPTRWTDALPARIWIYFSLSLFRAVLLYFQWNENVSWVHQTWNVVKFHVLYLSWIIFVAKIFSLMQWMCFYKRYMSSFFRKLLFVKYSDF